MTDRMRANIQKILEAVLFLLREATQSGVKVTQYDIVKSIFIADIWHLEKYGRPISFDNYAAMENGPVPCETYDLLKPDYPGERYFEGWPLWKTSPATDKGATATYYCDPGRDPNMRKLSQTDAQELAQALKQVLSWGFGATKDFTHLNPAYAAAWASRGKKKSVPMEYSKLLGDLDDDRVAQLIHASKHI